MGKAGIAVREAEDRAAALSFPSQRGTGLREGVKLRFGSSRQQQQAGFRHHLNGLKVKTRPKSSSRC